MKRFYILLILLKSTLVEAATTCGMLNYDIEKTQQLAIKFTNDMKVARLRGDIVSMQNMMSGVSNLPSFTKILENCNETERRLVCGYDCHSQIAEYHLFMASDLQYYYLKKLNRDQAISIKPEVIASHIKQGISVLEKAMPILETATFGDYRDMLRAKVNFQNVRTKLYMADGDNWYQSISNARVERLRYLIDIASNNGTHANENQASQSSLARAAYDKAMWTLQETSLDIPDNAFFSDIKTETNSLMYQIEKRQNSLKKGYLFLDIDPQLFSSGSIPRLREHLQKLMTELQSTENKIENMISQWIKLKGDQDVNEFQYETNENRTNNNFQINKSTYAIAKIQQDTENLKKEIEAKLKSVGDDVNKFNFEKQKALINAELKFQLAELEKNRLTINSRREIDFLTFEQSNQSMAQANLRWAINWKISVSNLEMQISNFNSQLTQYKSDLINKEAQLNLINQNRKSITNDISSKALEIERLKKNIEKLDLSRRQNIEVDQKLFETRICAKNIQLKLLSNETIQVPVALLPDFQSSCQIAAFPLTNDQYQKQMCDEQNGLRKKLGDAGIQQIEDTLCFVGLANIPQDIVRKYNLNQRCPNVQVSQDKLAKAIFDKEMKLSEISQENTKERIAEIRKSIQYFNQVMKSDFNNIVWNQLQSAISTVLVAASVPDVVAGPSGGTIVSVRDNAQVAWETVQAAIKFKMSKEQFEIQNKAKLNEININLTSALQALEENKIQSELRIVHAQRAMLEISGQSTNLANQLQMVSLQAEATILECQRDSVQINAQKQQIKNDIEQLLIEAQRIAYRNDDLLLSKESEQKQIKILETQIDNLKIKEKEADIQEQIVLNDIATTDKLIQDVNVRKKSIESLHGEVNKLQSESERITLTIADLEKSKQQKTLALSDIEYNYVSQLIKDKQNHAENLLKFENEARMKQILSEDLQKEIIRLSEISSKEIVVHQTNIMKFADDNVSTVSTAGDPLIKKVFVANQEQLAQMINGIPEFINEKKQIMEQANVTLVALRNRLTSLGSMTNILPLNNDFVYVRNAADLKSNYDSIQTAYLNPVTSPDVAKLFTGITKITLPSNSPIVRELVVGKSVRFEISPNTKNNPLAIWSSAFDFDVSGSKIRLMDMYLNVDFASNESCEGSAAIIEHLGAGYVFKEMSKNDRRMVPDLEVTDPRSKLFTYLANATVDRRYPDIRDFWQTPHNLLGFSEVDFLSPQMKFIKEDFSMLPLIANYRLQLGRSAEGCDLNSATFELIIAYARK